MRLIRWTGIPQINRITRINHLKLACELDKRGESVKMRGAPTQ